ncbi:MAG: hypothetical protein JWL90_374 [Chthoniobacteraceae bacterium]|nr:hypothetical protein [Chthoniobacteraceae bacterium]
MEPGIPATPVPIPVPLPLPGARVLMWKQDPSVPEINVRKTFLPGHVFPGPRDARLRNGTGMAALPSVSPNLMGDFIQTPGTAAFDSVHTFSVVRETLTMFQRALSNPCPWEWNNAHNVEPLSVYPHGLPDVMNAYYSRQEKALRFGDFVQPGTTPPQHIYTCRSFDIVAHETGHAVLDGIKPAWLGFNNPPQTGGLHESFGDLTAIFLALSQLDQVEAVVAQTKANLHDKTFLADLAEQFGLSLGRPNGLRNADNDLKLSEVGSEVHALSQVFTGAIYDILADIFRFEQRPIQRDDSAVLYEAGKYLCSLVIRAFRAAPNSAATFADVANQLLILAAADGKPTEYRNFIRNRFTLREVLVSPTPLSESHIAGQYLAANIQDPPGVLQNCEGCCGTMNHFEYSGAEQSMWEELEELKKSRG